jgi:hypothetical protein
MTGDNSLAAFLFTVLCLGAVIGCVAALDLLFSAHRRGVARLRAHNRRQKGTAS